MPKFFVTFDTTYVIEANDELDAIDNAEIRGKRVDGDIFVEEFGEADYK